MIPEEVIIKAIKDSLEILRSRIKTLLPMTLCHIGETVFHDTRQMHASFLKTPQDETLDLCILLRLAEAEVIVSGDLVKGGNGDVLSELEPLASSAQEAEAKHFEQHINQYILAQEAMLMQELR